MKKTKLLNAAVSYAVAKLGHCDELTICDAGLPIPVGVQRIDLAVTEGIPAFMDVVKAIVSEMAVQEVVIAEEFETVSPHLHGELLQCIRSMEKQQGTSVSVQTISHETFKHQTRRSVAIVRTGEFTPYANVILKAGVVF
ncbi:D-ribose pyranase [Pseudodesulfovibrio sp. JC047]|uniref:D-ribose pyranase n=1 Tax=Pseudodesulfovibrio sp. JC047 TaxID=2683199 RepID=UPI0013D6588D|nr:D-ribose pyranase [Pseudodesulfovibrio sp. JC047]NDV18485.1 D-ribose pyranase [Pseudodesulfovibrio sp. JC047]